MPSVCVVDDVARSKLLTADDAYTPHADKSNNWFTCVQSRQHVTCEVGGSGRSRGSREIADKRLRALCRRPMR
jgi:hypothetical protein